MAKISIHIEDLTFEEMNNLSEALSKIAGGKLHITARATEAIQRDLSNVASGATQAVAAQQMHVPREEPGADDGPKGKPEDDVFFRLSSFREVVKLLIERKEIPPGATADVVNAYAARLEALKVAGVPALAATPTERFRDKTEASLTALGVI